ncbi:CarD family transcriptional regulator [Collinsella tanakaei]|uniref:CarD family transcriptional regulator n=1 Tax=Collinsella tanakaei TaxID=626935 RepID=UPI001F1A3F56|nr:CarD family transcriptional regulator [Collinsella tanakaei]MCF2621962.1 CarD family transcriptional regulator [Collinsella tanakaei]MDM8302084.1 CarD family transcriptional regulator [Collinsella tanakaei]
MFDIGTHVIHPGQGVCTVMGYEDAPSPMIILEARSGHAKTRLLYPVSQLDRLHACIGKEQAEALIADYASLECDPYTERNSSLEESYFKQQIKLGAPETLRVAKTMRRRIRDAEAHAKKPSSYYTRILKEARRRSIEELAVALDVSEEDADGRLHAAAVEAGEIPEN